MGGITIITHMRNYKADKTAGNIYVDGKWFCYSLEDVGRPAGVKIEGETCIPEGVYEAKVSYSTRFNKAMILLYNRENMRVYGDNVSWSGVRVHGGNTINDSDGCVLAAYKRHEDGDIYQRASDDLAALLDGEKRVLWVISSIKGEVENA